MVGKGEKPLKLGFWACRYTFCDPSSFLGGCFLMYRSMKKAVRLSAVIITKIINLAISGMVSSSFYPIYDYVGYADYPENARNKDDCFQYAFSAFYAGFGSVCLCSFLIDTIRYVVMTIAGTNGKQSRIIRFIFLLLRL